jgi:MoaE-MoaD fusion protein
MQITLRFFAIVRERIGESERVVELPPGSRAADALAYVTQHFEALSPLFRTSMMMLNHEYVDGEATLSEGDEIAFIPPVSGGDHFNVHTEPLDATAIARSVERPDAGAVVTFVGTVRDHARGRQVLWLDYEAYPEAAVKMLARIGDELHAQWPVLSVTIEHRVGHMEPGVASVVIAVASAHRADAFAAAAHAIERIKQIVPIWKKEAYADGEVWIGSEAAYQVEIGRAS